MAEKIKQDFQCLSGSEYTHLATTIGFKVISSEVEIAKS